MIIDFIAGIITFVIVYFSFKYNYKKMESMAEKCFFILLVIAIIVIYVLYFIDKMNIPTLLKWSDNVSPQNWLNHFINIFSAILSQAISGLIAFLVAKMQIDNNNKLYDERIKEDRRINNMPLLVYSIKENDRTTNYNTSYTLINDYQSDMNSFILSIKNIGMNSVRNCLIKVTGNILPFEYECKLDVQSVLDKNEEKSICYFINLPTGESVLNINVFYEDLLFNHYRQHILLKCYNGNSDKYAKKTTYTYMVDNEKVIKARKNKKKLE